MLLKLPFLVMLISHISLSYIYISVSVSFPPNYAPCTMYVCVYRLRIACVQLNVTPTTASDVYFDESDFNEDGEYRSDKNYDGPHLKFPLIKKDVVTLIDVFRKKKVSANIVLIIENIILKRLRLVRATKRYQKPQITIKLCKLVFFNKGPRNKIDFVETMLSSVFCLRGFYRY